MSQTIGEKRGRLQLGGTGAFLGLVFETDDGQVFDVENMIRHDVEMKPLTQRFNYFTHFEDRLIMQEWEGTVTYRPTKRWATKNADGDYVDAEVVGEETVHELTSGAPQLEEPSDPELTP